MQFSAAQCRKCSDGHRIRIRTRTRARPRPKTASSHRSPLLGMIKHLGGGKPELASGKQVVSGCSIDEHTSRSSEPVDIYCKFSARKQIAMPPGDSDRGVVFIQEQQHKRPIISSVVEHCNDRCRVNIVKLLFVMIAIHAMQWTGE